MDAATRAQIMNSILPKVNETVTKEEDEVVSATPKNSDDNIFKYRGLVKYIHAYEKVIKEEDINWTDEQWESFHKWYLANKPKAKTLDLVSAAFEKKALREKEEADRKHALRKRIMEKVKFKI